MHASPASLAALVEKYRVIKRLRVEHAQGTGDDPRAAMRALARHFPGALRELDELPMEHVDARLQALEAALAGGAAPAWAALQLDYHATLRAALRIKRLVGRDCGSPADARARLAATYVPEPDEPSLGELDDSALASIVRPPGGRLNPWVFAQVAARHGVAVAAVRAALFVRERPNGLPAPDCS